MDINTQYFGTIHYTNEDLVTFPEGLFGFPNQHEFLPIPFEDDSDLMICLQALGDQSLSFILMNPFSLYSEYHPELSEEDLKALETQDEEKLSFYVICTVHEPLAESTVNLKSPLVVNIDTRKGRQVIIDHAQYQFRHKLKDFSDKEG